MAAENCFVTQATLSMMIKKLEQELDVVIFDRSKHPVLPTDIGKHIIEQARTVVQEANRLLTMARNSQEEIAGELRLGIIPTLAPYLLPSFLSPFLTKYPQLRLQIFELTTEQIVEKLEQQQLDVGILATPLNRNTLRETPLFYEEFAVYASPREGIIDKEFVLPGDIDINRLWLLEEGHCLRSQVVNLCELRNRDKSLQQLEFAAGSIDTLIRMVDANQGITILPLLALRDLTSEQRQCVRPFHAPAPVREISLVTYRHYLKEKMVEAIQTEILQSLPPGISTKKAAQVVSI